MDQQNQTNPQIPNPVPTLPQAQSPVQQPPVATPPPSLEHIPWSTNSLYAFSVIFGYVAGFLLTWQNIKRIGRDDLAKHKGRNRSNSIYSFLNAHNTIY